MATSGDKELVFASITFLISLLEKSAEDYFLSIKKVLYIFKKRDFVILMLRDFIKRDSKIC